MVPGQPGITLGFSSHLGVNMMRSQVERRSLFFSGPNGVQVKDTSELVAYLSTLLLVQVY